MNKYRIIEKRGEYKTHEEAKKVCPKTSPELFLINAKCFKCQREQKEYIPRFIVQKVGEVRIDRYSNSTKYIHRVETCEIEDLKEFTDLEEARKFKRDLELDEGIVIE